MTAADALGASRMEARVTVASGDALDVRRFTVEERMSTLFHVTIVAISGNPDVDFEALVGRPARFVLGEGLAEGEAGGKPARSWSGICTTCHQSGVEEDGASTYHLEIAPTLWLAGQRRNYRMFQQMSELDIALQILAEWEIAPEKRLTGTYKSRKYRVQYGESDLAFVMRMLEDAGIAFHFTDEGGESRLVLADAPQGNAPRPPIPYRDDVTTALGEYLTCAVVGRRVRPGRYTVRDHDYRKAPSYKLAAGAGLPGEGVEQRLEQYHYQPGAFLFGTDQGEATPHADDRGKTRTDEGEGAVLAQKRLDAERGDAARLAFRTSAFDLTPGSVMSVLGHSRTDLGDGKTWLVVSSMLEGQAGERWTHDCEAHSTTVAYRPPLATPKPKALGVESATVVGTAGDEIHTDEFGRVRVHFHWDRESQMDDRSSCWIHVSQPWGGAGYGGSSLPRVGQEVLVDFIGADPDKPVIVGRVYTNLQKTPYKLPDSKTQSGWKSNSTGGTGGYNELMFEDAGGQELLRMQAEKDMTKLVKNDESSTVGHDRTRLVKRNESVTVGGNRTHRVKLNEQHVVGVSQTVTVGVNRATQVGAIDSTSVGDTHVVTISPPGEGGPAPETSFTMSDKKIVLDTGAGATITMEGDIITIAANVVRVTAEDYAIVRGGKLYLRSTTGKVEMTSVADVDIQADKDAIVKTTGVIKLNCD